MNWTEATNTKTRLRKTVFYYLSELRTLMYESWTLQKCYSIKYTRSSLSASSSCIGHILLSSGTSLTGWLLISENYAKRPDVKASSKTTEAFQEMPVLPRQSEAL